MLCLQDCNIPCNFTGVTSIILVARSFVGCIRRMNDLILKFIYVYTAGEPNISEFVKTKSEES